MVKHRITPELHGPNEVPQLDGGRKRHTRKPPRYSDL